VGVVVDWSVFHALNGALSHRDGAQDAAQIFNAWAIFVLLAVAGGIWFVARPGGSPRSKLAAASAAASAAVALLVNAALGQLWFHDRPFVDHPRATVLLVRHAPDNSFPSDHASVAFAAAFAVIAFHRRLGLLLVVGAAAIAVDRIFVGVHYPLDVAVSLLVGLGCALVVVTLGRGVVAWIVGQLSRLSDPVVARTRGLIE
jgi:undecaprenyl-diphosphatase